MTRELTTSIEIDAPPERVWDVLVDFDHYHEWNPFMRVAGRPNEGATLTVHLMPPGGRESVFEPDVTHCEKHRELRWLGDETRAGFEAMNEALKTRVEGLVEAEEREAVESS
ncbi:SRPBCC family protein [Haloferax sp. S1W]|uniref:SRPBCC family protein n=1 Tax=Haloferax sp. S1W TaxID=3377110 RepID=UPI0037CBB5FF